jgi:hypothetical protein
LTNKWIRTHDLQKSSSKCLFTVDRIQLLFFNFDKFQLFSFHIWDKLPRFSVLFIRFFLGAFAIWLVAVIVMASNTLVKLEPWLVTIISFTNITMPAIVIDNSVIGVSHSMPFIAFGVFLVWTHALSAGQDNKFADLNKLPIINFPSDIDSD